MNKDYNKDLFEELLGSTQYRLIYDVYPKKLKDLGYNDIEFIGDNLFAHGNVPIMLVSHADIVGTDYPTEFIYEKNDSIIRANNRTLGGDDRCGGYIILEALKKLNVRPYICITHDEEKGCLGADEFTTKMPYNEYEIKFMIELDRRGSNDLVYYDCDGYDEFMKFCEDMTGYKHAHGSYSDICSFMDEWKVCGVNLSCGYYNEHTSQEYVVINEMLNTKDVLVNWLNNIDYDTLPRFDYTPKQTQGYSSNWDWLFDSYEEGKDLFPNEDYSPYDEDTEDIIEHEGVSYGVCADCGALVPLTEEALKYGIILCHDCRGYYDDVCSSGDRSLYKLF